MTNDRSYRWGWHPEHPTHGVRRRRIDEQIALHQAGGRSEVDVAPSVREPGVPDMGTLLDNALADLKQATSALRRGDGDGGLRLLVRAFNGFVRAYEQDGEARVRLGGGLLSAQDAYGLADSANDVRRLFERGRTYDGLLRLSQVLDRIEDGGPHVFLTNHLEMVRRPTWKRLGY